MEAYILQSSDVVDERFLELYQQTLDQDNDDVFVILDMLISAGHYNRYKHVVHNNPIVEIDPNWQYMMMADILATRENFEEWINTWFNANRLYDRHEILNSVSGNRGLLLNHLLNTYRDQNNLEMILQQAIIAGCDPLSISDGVPPVIAIYEHCQYNLNQSEYYMKRVVFDHIEVTGQALDNCRLRNTDENLLHVAARHRDNEGLEYFVRTLHMNVNSKYAISNCGFDNYTDNFYGNVSQLYQFWFHTLNADVHLLFQGNRGTYTLFTKYCGLKDPTLATLMLDDGANVHLGSLNPGLVCASSGHHELTKRLIDMGVSLVSYDSKGNSIIYYMIDKYHTLYYDVFVGLNDDFLAMHLTNNVIKWTIVHTVAAMGPTNLLKYLIDTRGVAYHTRDARGFDIMQIAIVCATKELKLDILNRVFKNIYYLLFEVGVKPDVRCLITPTYGQEQTISTTSVEMVLAALLHYTHRVSITHLDLPPLAESPDEDMDNLEQVFLDHDALPVILNQQTRMEGLTQQENIEAQMTSNRDRIFSAMDYVYTLMPWLRIQFPRQRGLIIVASEDPARAHLANMYKQELENVIMKQKPKMYELAVRMIEMSRHVDPMFKVFFHSQSFFMEILNRGMTLRGLSRSASIRASGQHLDRRFRWY
ncbi:Serine/threonine-protein phosphatase 6 regulatory ankyrin repeat subunit [Scale drop disease virus]|uniref:Serine/threonine-protein phosphatase 6 regulatory ankyrin repeat subunit n=1 Tax=Scale drop disease virus TaxID=1697349 RepID=A0A7D5UKV9_9VIRU|nr:Serine/threonine-protein phosphatase 6 regulatory ankyrin repeat subunit [Scale drop disease virus]QXJ13581.1 hypothetical protein PMJGCIOK_00014 [Scale drop disease virus]